MEDLLTALLWRRAWETRRLPPYHLISELGFASETAMQEGLNSDAGQAMAKDMANFASGGVTVLFAHATTEKLGELR